MLSLTVTVTAVERDSLTVVTEDGQTLRVNRENELQGVQEGASLILTLTRDTDIVNAILTDTPDDQEKNNSSQ